MKTCSPLGRECIEKKFTQTFNCSIACEGIYADVNWVKEMADEDIEDHNPVEVKLFNGEGDNGEESEDMHKQVRNADLLSMYKSLKKEMSMLKESLGKNGKEVDREKYLTLVSEYKRFKRNNVRHFRFNSASSMTQFGEFNL